MGQRVKPPTTKQRNEVYDRNKQKNGGKLKCDMCGSEIEPAKKDSKGVAPKPNSASIDHINARSRGGTNDPSNLGVLAESVIETKVTSPKDLEQNVEETE